jgi:transposase
MLIWKSSRTFNVSSSAVAKTIKLYDKTGSHEDSHRKGRPRVNSAAEDKFIRVPSLRNCSPNKCFSEFK